MENSVNVTVTKAKLFRRFVSKWVF